MRTIKLSKDYDIYEQKLGKRIIYVGEKHLYLPFPYTIFIVKKFYWFNALQVGWSNKPIDNLSQTIYSCRYPITYLDTSRLIVCCEGKPESFWNTRFADHDYWDEFPKWPVNADFSFEEFDLPMHPARQIEWLANESCSEVAGYLARTYPIR